MERFFRSAQARLHAVLLYGAAAVWALPGVGTGQAYAGTDTVLFAGPKEAAAAVGLLLRDGGVHCRVTLLDATHAMTAGHCVRDPGGNSPLENLSIGWSDGHHTRVTDVALVPGFRYDSYLRATHDVLVEDVAVVRIAPPVDMPPLNLFRAEGRSGKAWVIDGDGEGWEECPFEERGGDPALLWLGCTRDPGQSGSPVVVMSGDRADVIGMVIARAPQGGLFAHRVGPTLGRLLWNKTGEDKRP